MRTQALPGNGMAAGPSDSMSRHPREPRIKMKRTLLLEIGHPRAPNAHTRPTLASKAIVRAARILFSGLQAKSGFRHESATSTFAKAPERRAATHDKSKMHARPADPSSARQRQGR